MASPILQNDILEYILINVTWLWACSNLILGCVSVVKPYFEYKVCVTSLFVAAFAVAMTDRKVHGFNYLSTFGTEVRWLSGWLSFPFLLLQLVPFTFINLHLYRRYKNKCKAQWMTLLFAFAFTYVLTTLFLMTLKTFR